MTEKTMTKIKICGITNISDVLAASELGADAIGFIFAKSPRKVTATKVKKIVKRLPPFIFKVGVFVDEKASTVNRIIKECNLDFVQLHGSESPSYCKRITAPVIKAFRMKDRASLKQISKYNVLAFLLDTYEKEMSGGTGKVFNWNLAKAAKRFGRPIILSGGLNPNNVARAIKKVRPYAVDVGSGVEAYPGKKSIRKLKSFIYKVKSLNN